MWFQMRHHGKETVLMSKQATWASVTLAVLLVVGGCTTLGPDPVEVLSAKYGRRFWHVSPHKRFGLGWTTGPWKHTQQFRDAKSAVESAFSAPFSDADMVVSTYRNRAANNPKSALALFQWAHAMLLAGGRAADNGESYWFTMAHLQDAGALDWLMTAGPQSKDIEYVKAHYFVASVIRYRKELIPLGYRLLKADPDDEAVKRTVAYQLGSSDDPLELSQAIGRAEDLARRHPGNIKYVALVGHVYGMRWLQLGERKEDGEAMVKWGKRYLELAPKGSWNSKSEARIIDYVTKELETKR